MYIAEEGDKSEFSSIKFGGYDENAFLEPTEAIELTTQDEDFKVSLKQFKIGEN